MCFITSPSIKWPKIQAPAPVLPPVAPMKDAAKAIVFLFPKKSNG